MSTCLSFHLFPICLFLSNVTGREKKKKRPVLQKLYYTIPSFQEILLQNTLYYSVQANVVRLNSCDMKIIHAPGEYMERNKGWMRTDRN